MPRVIPFRGLRFHARHAAEMSRLAAPPYDVISEQDRLRYEGLHPRNVVRLILPGEAGRVEDGSFYAGAAALLRKWQEEGTLELDPRPAFYPYRQTFMGPEGERAVRLGFLGSLALPPGQEGDNTVLPHETTLDGPRKDRTRLITACRANLSPVFLLHPDSTGRVETCLQDATSDPPLFAFEDAAGVLHELWKMEDTLKVARLEEALLPDWSLIADGHHRYESALAVRDSLPDEEGAGGVLAFFCSLRDRGFRVFPIHRLLRARGARAGSSNLAKILARQHVLEEIPSGAGPDQILGHLRRIGERCVAVVTPDAAPLVVRMVPADRTPGDPVEDLDTVLLQREILTGVLGISGEDVAGGAIGYTSDAVEAVRQVRSGEARAAFLLNPLKVESVIRAAQAGRRLPQKSTYFYPKVYTGLVIRPF